MDNKKLINRAWGVILVLFFCTIGAVAQNAPADDAPALTIYNQNFFVARERLPMDLKAGVNHVEFAGIAAHLEPDSVILRDPNGRALQILEQNYRNDPISQELLLSFYEGKAIDFLVQRGEKQETIRGKIIRSGYVPSVNYSNGYPAAGFWAAADRSRRRVALRAAGPASLSRADRRFNPEADLELGNPDQ